MALVASLDNGLLKIQGSAGDDAVAVDVVDDQISVTINSALFMAPLADVQRIRIKAGAGDDRVTLSEAVDVAATISGGAGNDRLRGGSGPCKLSGEAGNDTLVGGLARDSLSGGAGIDTVDYSARTENLRITLDGKANDGAAPGTGYGRKGETDNVWVDVENVRGGSGNDYIAGGQKGNTLMGGAGDDTVIGGAGSDLLVGGSGEDSLVGGAGDDILLAIDAESGDTVDGGDGFDNVAYDLITGSPDRLLNCENEISILEL